jgi:hypothetical protein
MQSQPCWHSPPCLRSDQSELRYCEINAKRLLASLRVIPPSRTWSLIHILQRWLRMDVTMWVCRRRFTHAKT